MERYGKAWMALDSDMILKVFTMDATYQETPFKEPYRGHSEIKKYWDEVVKAKEKDVKFYIDKVYIDKDIGIAEWHTTFIRTDNGNEEELKGVILAEVRGEKINRLWEYWVKQEKRIKIKVKRNKKV